MDVSMNEEKNKCCSLKNKSFPKGDSIPKTLFAFGGRNNRFTEHLSLWNDFSFGVVGVFGSI